MKMDFLKTSGVRFVDPKIAEIVKGLFWSLFDNLLDDRGRFSARILG